MELTRRLQKELKDALKEGDRKRVDVLRYLLAQLQNKAIEKRGRGEKEELEDADVVEVFQREVKKRRESIELFKKGGRSDLVQKEEDDLKIIEEYLPQMASKEDVLMVIDTVIAGGVSDFPFVMREAMQKLKGKADGALVRACVEERLKSK